MCSTPEASLTVPDFTNSVCTAVHVIFLSFLPHSRLFAISFYLMASPRQDGTQSNRYSRQNRFLKKTEKEGKLHELPSTEIV